MGIVGSYIHDVYWRCTNNYNQTYNALKNVVDSEGFYQIERFLEGDIKKIVIYGPYRESIINLLIDMSCGYFYTYGEKCDHYNVGSTLMNLSYGSYKLFTYDWYGTIDDHWFHKNLDTYGIDIREIIRGYEDPNIDQIYLTFDRNEVGIVYS